MTERKEGGSRGGKEERRKQKSLASPQIAIEL